MFQALDAAQPALGSRPSSWPGPGVTHLAGEPEAQQHALLPQGAAGAGPLRRGAFRGPESSRRACPLHSTAAFSACSSIAQGFRGGKWVLLLKSGAGANPPGDSAALLGSETAKMFMPWRQASLGCEAVTLGSGCRWLSSGKACHFLTWC